LTHDRGFLDDRRFPLNRNPGVIVMFGGDGKGDGLPKAIAMVVTLVGNFRYLFPNAKIGISEEGLWSVRLFDREQGSHIRRRLRFGKHGKTWEWQE
jgi:hypothetical protein